jgi:hypothetical protein
LEAEGGQLSGGFTVGDDPSASGQHYIEPPIGESPPDQPGSARALYTLAASSPGVYLIWGRIRSPDPLHNRFWIQVDGGTWYQWRISTGEIWYWDPFHDNTNYGVPLKFELSAGSHELIIANSVDTVRLDRLYFTDLGDAPPGNDTPCHPPDSIDMGGVCFPSCGSQGGNTCGDLACSGLTILKAYDCGVCCIAP